MLPLRSAIVERLRVFSAFPGRPARWIGGVRPHVPPEFVELTRLIRLGLDIGKNFGKRGGMHFHHTGEGPIDDDHH
jgi:hypothetical protein